jgi:hypothetical protein
VIVGRIAGWLLIALALLLLGVEVVASLEAGAYQGLALGLVWFRIDPGSLNLIQAVTQRFLHPAIWDPAAITVLQWPGWLVFGVPGILLVVLFRRRRGKPKRWFTSRGRLS